MCCAFFFKETLETLETAEKQKNLFAERILGSILNMWRAVLACLAGWICGPWAGSLRPLP